MTTFTGTRALVRLALRRERIRLPLWLLAVVALLASGVGAFQELYPTVADRLELAASPIATNPAVVALYGPAIGFETLGGIVAWRYGLFAHLVVGLLAGFLVLRHTRHEEETGRADLVSSAVVGRHARLAAALLVATGFALVTGVVIALAMLGAGEGAAGSWAFGLGVAGVGWCFAGVGAVAAQFVDHARTARGIVGAVFGLAFLLRAAANWSAVSNPGADGGSLEPLAWLSPLGWAQELHAYQDNRWWVLLLSALWLAVLAYAAATLSVHRDVGASMIPPRAGRPAATPRLASTWALAWRLQRGSLLGWAAGFAFFGLVLGLMLADAGDIFSGNEEIADLMAEFGGAGAIIDTMVAVFMGVAGWAAAAYGVTAALRLRAEETELRAEPVLGTSVSRWQWAASHLLVAAVGVVVLMATVGLLSGAVHGLRSGDAGETWRVLGAALVQVPAAWTLAGVTALLFGLLPRVTALAWAAVLVVVLVGMFGPLLELPQWALDLSPFIHVPLLPTAEFTAMPLLWLLAVSLALVAAGLLGFRRRDLASN